jgi:hypothetical protein
MDGEGGTREIRGGRRQGAGPKPFKTGYGTMGFAKWVFRIAGIYGLVVLAPQYFMEAKTGRDFPPEITHPEYFYGFIGVALAWQVAFLVLSTDPVRYRPMMIPSVLEKVSFGVAGIALYATGRLATQMFAASLLDLLLAVLFVAAYVKTPARG